MASVAVGVDASVTSPSGVAAKFDRFEIAPRKQLVPIPGFDSGGYEEYGAGLKGGAFTASGHHNYNDTSTSPGLLVDGTWTFQIAPGCTYSASCLTANQSHTVDLPSGESRVTYQGVTSGTITLTWDETP